MKIDEVRESIANRLGSYDVFDLWAEVLDNSTPGHYGINDLEVSLSYQDIFVDIPANSFTFKDARMSVSLRLGGSSDKNGYDESFNITISGGGEFSFGDDKKIYIDSIYVNEPIELYDPN